MTHLKKIYIFIHVLLSFSYSQESKNKIFLLYFIDPVRDEITLNAWKDTGMWPDKNKVAAILLEYFFDTETSSFLIKSGEENIFSMDVGNLGTAPIDNIKFSLDDDFCLHLCLPTTMKNLSPFKTESNC